MKHPHKLCSLLLVTCSLLLFSGCGTHSSYRIAEELKKQYPGCELRELKTFMNISFYVRTANGAVFLVSYSNEGRITRKQDIFPQKS